MSDQPKKPAEDTFGGFLSQYGEYLAGRRSYSDLPIPTSAELKAAEQSLAGENKKR